MSRIIVALVDSAQGYRRYFEPVMKAVFGASRVTVVTHPVPQATFVVFSYHGHTGNQRRGIRGKRIMVNGEPDSSRPLASNKIGLLLDCKNVVGHRIPGAGFAYLPFYVLSFAERYKNAPRNLIKPPGYDAGQILSRKTKFCAFMYSHTRPKHRSAIFLATCRYKRVDPLGRAHNPNYKANDRQHYVPGKSTYMDLSVQKYRPYKFVLCIENTLGQPGYITEKIVSAMLANCVPIYWGAPDASKHFNPKSFIDVSKFKNLAQAVRHIAAVDKDPDKYKAILSEPWFHGNKLPKVFSQTYLGRALKSLAATAVAPERATAAVRRGIVTAKVI